MMTLSFELLWDWVIKKMNLDEQFSDNANKQMLIQLWNENVILLTPKNLKKAAILQPFFLQ